MTENVNSMKLRNLKCGIIAIFKQCSYFQYSLGLVCGAGAPAVPFSVFRSLGRLAACCQQVGGGWGTGIKDRGCFLCAHLGVALRTSRQWQFLHCVSCYRAKEQVTQEETVALCDIPRLLDFKVCWKPNLGFEVG